MGISTPSPYLPVKLRLTLPQIGKRPSAGEKSSSLLQNGSREGIETVESVPEPKKPRRNSFSTAPDPIPYPQPQPPSQPASDVVLKSVKVTGPRHSLPKAKLPRPQPVATSSRMQPTRSGGGGGDTQPSSARATPAAEEKDRSHPLRVPRVPLGVRIDTTTENDIRSEAAYIIAQAALRRQESAAIKANDPTVNGSTPSISAGQASSSSGNCNLPPSPPQSSSARSDPIIHYRPTVNVDAEEDDFDTAFEKVQAAYRNGIRPHNNPRAPQERSVPINGMEDAHPPEWRSDQRPGIALAPGRDRIPPTDKMELAHRQGFDGLTDDLEIDAQGFVNNVRVGLLS